MAPAVVRPLETLLDILMKVIVVRPGATDSIFFITCDDGAKVVSTKRIISFPVYF